MIKQMLKGFAIAIIASLFLSVTSSAEETHENIEGGYQAVKPFYYFPIGGENISS